MTPQPTTRRPEGLAPAQRGATFMPMIVGGLIVLVGLLAFVFAGPRDPDVQATGSIAPAAVAPSTAPPTNAAPASSGGLTTPQRP